jgi:anion-transporting  ArsA/GET3 family ATPase
LFNAAGRPMLRIADSILGSDLLERVAEFLLDLRTTYDGVSQRGREIERVLRSAAILVVTTSDPAPVWEAIKFFRELPKLASTPAAVVFNRILPETWATAAVPAGAPPILASNLIRWSAETVRQRDTRDEFSARYGAQVATIPWSMSPPTDLDGLAGILDHSKGMPWASFGIETPEYP